MIIIQKKEKAMRIQFTDWLYEVYSIQEVSTKLFITLDRVYKGTYKNVKDPIDVTDLWDAWYRKFPQLQKFHSTEFFQRKKMNDVDTILYDLGIILKQWDQYLAWQEDHQQEVDQSKKMFEELIDYSKLVSTPHNKKREDIDLDKAITDIWGDDNNG